MSHPVAILDGMSSSNQTEGASASLADLCKMQHGVVSRAQLRSLGISDATISRMAGRGWRRVHPGVLASVTTRETYMQKLWAARLAVGDECVVSHEAAARLHRLTGFSRAGVFLTAPHRTHHRVRGSFVHQIDDMFNHAGHRTLIQGLQVSSVARTFVDLSTVAHPARLKVSLDDALSHKRTSVGAVGRVLADIARPGKRGLEPIARALSAHQPAKAIAGSILERRLIDLLLQAGEPLPLGQVGLPSRGVIDGIVDFMYPEALLIIEVDGRCWHARISALARDHLRDAEAAALGYLTLRPMYEHMNDDPHGVIDLIRRTRLTRTAQLAA